MIRSLSGRAYHRWLLLREPRTARRLRAISRRQWWAADALQEAAEEEVEAAVRAAATTVPYYRDRLRELDLAPARFSFTRDFARIPILTKETIQREGERLLAEGTDRGRLARNQTGGSTGQLIHFYQDAAYACANEADKILSYAMCGYRPGDRWAFLWGSDRDAPAGGWTAWKERHLRNRLWMNAFHFDRDRLGEWCARLQAFRPRLLVGYVSALTWLASYIRERRIEGIHPSAVQTTAEALGADQRRLIQEVFGAPVYNRYGCREVGNIAQECSAHQGLHVLSLTNYVELLCEGRPARPGEVGRIVVTNLTNRVFPFIRYDTGDLGLALGAVACRCGRGLPRIAGVEGRVSDVLVTPEGERIHGEYFTHLFYHMPGVRQFQVEQVALERLVLRIVRGAGFRDEALSALLDEIGRSASPSFRIELEFPDTIPLSASGKFRYTISRISRPGAAEVSD